MANYKLVDAEKLDADLQTIADAIKAKTGDNSTLAFPTDFAAEISNITGGGGGSSADGCVTVTFMNGDDVLFSRPVYIGDDCPDPIVQGHIATTPTKDSTEQYNYTFYGWGASDGGAADANILKDIRSDKTVYAVFTATVRTYTATLYDSDKTTVLYTEQVAYGSKPSYKPTKTGYTFAGWTPTTAVTGDTSYVAVWIQGTGGTLNDGAIAWSIANSVLTFTGTGEMPDFGRVVSNNKYVTDAPWYEHRGKFTSVVIGEGITKIGHYAFVGLTNITSASIPSTIVVSSIHWFYGCSNLSNVTIAQGATLIGGNAFYDCTKLTTITIPASVTRIEYCAFSGSGLTSATFEVTTGWWYGAYNDTSGTAISNLSNKSTAATYLKDTYKLYYWNRT